MHVPHGVLLLPTPTDRPDEVPAQSNSVHDANTSHSGRVGDEGIHPATSRSSGWPPGAIAVDVLVAGQKRVYVQGGGRLRELMRMAFCHRQTPWKTPRDGWREVVAVAVVVALEVEGGGGGGSARLT